MTTRHNLYYIIMSFARFNLFALSYTFLLTRFPARASPLFKLRFLEIIGIAFFWTWFTLLLKAIPGGWNRAMFVFVSFAVTSPLHVQVSPPEAKIQFGTRILNGFIDRSFPLLTTCLRDLRHRAPYRTSRIIHASSTQNYDGHFLSSLLGFPPWRTQLPS